jgi:hypothetical protein
MLHSRSSLALSNEILTTMTLVGSHNYSFFTSPRRNENLSQTPSIASNMTAIHFPVNQIQKGELSYSGGPSVLVDNGTPSKQPTRWVPNLTIDGSTLSSTKTHTDIDTDHCLPIIQVPDNPSFELNKYPDAGTFAQVDDTTLLEEATRWTPDITDRSTFSSTKKPTDIDIDYCLVIIQTLQNRLFEHRVSELNVFSCTLTLLTDF